MAHDDHCTDRYFPATWVLREMECWCGVPQPCIIMLARSCTFTQVSATFGDAADSTAHARILSFHAPIPRVLMIAKGRYAPQSGPGTS